MGSQWSAMAVGDAAEFDDGEFAGELALEGVDAAADLGDGHGVCLVIVRIRIFRIGEKPFISAHFGSFE